MKCFILLWLSVSLAPAKQADILNHMPTVLIWKPTPPAQNFDVGAHEENLNTQPPNTETTVEDKTTETTLETVNDEVNIPTDIEEVADELTVNTTYGPVQGVKAESGNLISYFDIPYGRFNNTFQAPLAPEPWTDKLNNIQHVVKCPQLDGGIYIGSTNCLTISVFTSEYTVNASVLFYIHESHFSTGSGDPVTYRPDALVARNVVIVLPNYRLGPLGFLCLRNSTAPGNAALKDLTMALEWTRNNIRAFGGDPSNIAVSGDGASAALAMYLALSPRSKSLITKVVTDSGTALSHWAIDRNPAETARTLAELIRNNTRETELSDDLFSDTSITVENIVTTSRGIKLQPCIEQAQEGFFITDTPWNILESENIDKSFIIGTASHAGLLEALRHDKDSLMEMNYNFSDFIPNDLLFQTTTELLNVAASVRLQYFGTSNITLESLEELSLYHTDVSYLGPSLRVARALVKAGARVFLYEFSFVGALNHKLASLEEAPGYGAVRGDIVGYLFPENKEEDTPLMREEEIDQSEDRDERVIKVIADMWVSFLETGEPTAEGVIWRPLKITTDELEDFLSIGNDTKPFNGVHTDRLRLWTDIYNQHFVDNNPSVRIASGYFVIGTAIVFLGMSKISVS